MKIAFFHELSFGGARRVCDEYGKILAKNHTVDLYYVDEQEDKSAQKIFTNSFFFQFIPKEQKKGQWQKRLYKDTLELFHLAKLHKKIAEKIDAGNYDFVFVHPSKFTQAPFLLRFVKTPKIYFCQEPLRIVYDDFLRRLPKVSLPKRIYERGIRRLRKSIDAQNIAHANVLLANSKFSKQQIKIAYQKFARVCYLGVDITLFRPLPLRKQYDILFLGQALPIEGYDLLENAVRFFKKRPKIKIIERGNDGISITDEELVAAYNKAKVVVCLSRNEPFGLTIIEAMSCGVPVIAVKEGGFLESVVNGKTGLLVNRNPKKLYLILEKLLNDAKLRDMMGKNGREDVLKNWTWEKSVARFLKIVASHTLYYSNEAKRS